MRGIFKNPAKQKFINYKYKMKFKQVRLFLNENKAHEFSIGDLIYKLLFSRIPFILFKKLPIYTLTKSKILRSKVVKYINQFHTEDRG